MHQSGSHPRRFDFVHNLVPVADHLDGDRRARPVGRQEVADVPASVLDTLLPKTPTIHRLHVGKTVAFVAIHGHDFHRASFLRANRIGGFHRSILPARERRFHTTISTKGEARAEKSSYRPCAPFARSQMSRLRSAQPALSTAEWARHDKEWREEAFPFFLDAEGFRMYYKHLTPL